jgi:hypothetical protein
MSESFDDDPAVAFDSNPDFLDDLCDEAKLKICQTNRGGAACFAQSGCVAP